MGQKDIFQYYSNISSVDVGLFDFILKFGIKKKRNSPVTEEDFDLEIAISPQHAKSFLEILEAAVNDYEREFGKINLRQIESNQLPSSKNIM